jgi:hypothetical protein
VETGELRTTAGAGHLGQGQWESTVRTRHPRQKSRDSSARQEQGTWDRISVTERITETEQLGQVSLDRLAFQVSLDKT